MAKKGDIKADKEKFKEVVAAAVMPQDEQPEIQVSIGGEPVKQRKKRITKAEREAMNKRPIATEANPLFVPIVRIPFDIWAKSTVPEMSLSDDEARLFALPITQLVEYYLPAMPEIWAVWANLTVQVFGIMSVRLAMLAEIRRKNMPKPDATPGDNAPTMPASHVMPGEFRPKVI